MKKIKVQNVIWKEGKYFVAQCLNVDVSSFGKTRQEATEALAEALELYFEDCGKCEFEKVEQPKIISHELVHA